MMKTKLILILLVLTVLIVSCTEPKLPAEVENKPMIMADYSVEIQAGNTFVVPVKVTDWKNVYGFQFDIDYNPDFLEFQEIKESETLTAFGYPDDVFCKSPDTEVPGKVKNIACTRMKKIGGVDLEGTIYEVTFKALKAGSPSIGFSNVKLVDSDIQDMPGYAQSLNLNII